jgi:starch synthase
MNIVIDDTDHPLIIKVATLQPTRMQVYFIDNDDYFLRHAAEGLETETHAADNDERSMFYVRGVLETVKKLRWVPSVIHCTGWITALAPIYLKRLHAEDPTFCDAKIVYSLFDQPFQGTLDARMADKLLQDGFSAEDLKALGDKPVDYATLNRLAIDYSDAIAISSENIDAELIEYARQSGKPILEYPGEENYAEAYKAFYESL